VLADDLEGCGLTPAQIFDSRSRCYCYSIRRLELEKWPRSGSR
jgi:hypothetical protein